MAHENRGEWQELRDYVNASGSDNDFVEHCFDEATVLVEQYIGDATVDADAKIRAILECGSELYHRRAAPNGVAQFATMDGNSAIRVARDPMVGAYPILARWLPAGGLGIA